MARQLKAIRNNIVGRITLDQLVIGIIFLVVAAELLTLSIKYGIKDGSILGVILALLAFAVGGAYFMFFMKESVLYKSTALVKYGIKYIQRSTEADKFACTKTEINSKFPIKAVYNNGMVEFNGKQFGTLLKLEFPDISAAGHAGYLIRTIDILNSLPEGIIYKSHKYSNIDTETPELDQIQDAINDPDATEEMKKHLRSSYEELLKVPGKVLWEGHGFIGVGKYKNADKAFDESKIVVEVITKSLQDAGIITTRMTDEYAILLTYRQMLSMRRVF